MTDDQKPEHLGPSAYTPLVPRPLVIAIASLVSVLLAFNVVYDAVSHQYSGAWVTFLLGSIVLVLLGVPFGMALRNLRP